MNADQAFQQALALSKNYIDESLQGAGALKGEKGDKGDNGLPGKDGITYTPEIGTVTTVLSTEDASASVDIDEENHTASFNFSIPKGEKGDDGNAGTGGSVDFADVPTATELTPDNYAVVGTEAEMQKIKMDSFLDFIRENGLFDLDGKGRPLLPGYGIVTTKVLADFTNGSGETGKTYTELFGIENRNDITFIYGYTLNNEAIDSALIDSDTGEVRFVNRGNSNTKDVTVYAFCVYKLPVPYEPGLKSITKEFTVSSSASKSGIICNLSDFGVGVEDVVSFAVHSKNNELLFLYSLIPPEYIKWNYPGSALDFSNVTFSVTITIKDYSSIGPSIVTDGIRMITKDFTVSTPQNVSFVSICNISDFGISNLSDVIGIIGYADRYATTWYSISSSGDIYCNYYNTLPTGSVDYKLSLIVKVPVVEEGPPIGEIISYMGTTAPNKFLFCDGTAYNISDYPQLAEHFTDQFGSVNHFGGDGTTTFAVPDLRGEFLRGSGTATRNTGTGAAVGEHQDGTENLKYQTNIGSGGTAFSVSNANGDNLIVHNEDHVTSIKTTDKYINYTGAKATSSETWYTSRPTNTAVLYCIRAKK